MCEGLNQKKVECLIQQALAKNLRLTTYYNIGYANDSRFRLAGAFAHPFDLALEGKFNSINVKMNTIVGKILNVENSVIEAFNSGFSGAISSRYRVACRITAFKLGQSLRQMHKSQIDGYF